MRTGLISWLNDNDIRNALNKLNKHFYYGAATININTGTFLSSSKGDIQNYIVEISYQGIGDIIHILAKNDDSGNIDCIKVFDRNGIDKLIELVKNNMDFWGFSISSIEEQYLYEGTEEKKYYELKVNNNAENPLNVDQFSEKVAFILKDRKIIEHYDELKRFYNYFLDNITQIYAIKNSYVAGSIFAIISYEKILGCGHAPRLAYKCFTSDTRFVESNRKGCKYNLRSTIERLQLIMNGGMRLIEEKVNLFKMPPTQVVDFAILSDVLKLQISLFYSREQWWKRVLEDAMRIRGNYLQYSDEEIIRYGEFIHGTISESIEEYLTNCFGK